MNVKQIVVAKEAETLEVVNFLLGIIPKKNSKAFVVTLSGSLGVGKTTFTQYFGRALGVFDRITSPTYGILDSYKITPVCGFTRLIHMDVYRLKNIQDLKDLYWNDYYLDSKNIICMEWPSAIGFNNADVVISISFKNEKIDEQARVFDIQWEC